MISSAISPVIGVIIIDLFFISDAKLH